RGADVERCGRAQRRHRRGSRGVYRPADPLERHLYAGSGGKLLRPLVAARRRPPLPESLDPGAAMTVSARCLVCWGVAGLLCALEAGAQAPVLTNQIGMEFVRIEPGT